MTELQSITDLLLAAAIKDRDPDTFRALADACDDAGDEAHAYGWREVADWMEMPWPVPSRDWEEKIRWPSTLEPEEEGEPLVYYFWTSGTGDDDYDCYHVLPWGDDELSNFVRRSEFATEHAAITWLCEEFIKRR